MIWFIGYYPVDNFVDNFVDDRKKGEFEYLHKKRRITFM